MSAGRGLGRPAACGVALVAAASVGACDASPTAGSPPSAPAPPAVAPSASARSAATTSSARPTSGPPAWAWALPPGFPEPIVPADNPMSAAKVELGRHLFFDPRLSEPGTQSCATCHQPARAFTDGLARPTAASGALLPRSTSTLANVAYFAALTWQNPVLTRLEKHVLVPLFGNDPVEMGWHGRERDLEARLAGDETYRRLFAAAYPGDEAPVRASHVTRALAAFTRTIVSGGSRWDRFTRGDRSALTAQEQRGLALFRGDRMHCTKCHDGFTLSDAISTDPARSVEKARFFNTGLYDVDGKGRYPEPSLGIYALSGRPDDLGKMRAPTLRNVAVTAPYMHDGSIATLGEVLDVYAAGGRAVTSGPAKGDGRKSPLKSDLVGGFTMSPAERADVVAFLGALTDDAFLGDPRWADPWRAGSAATRP